ncbi:MAG TPA: PLDc N-terminal domain-containing protein [Gaiellaceae bacterium]|nr:PLDc N-terminal domain-containing protein [Gaiellaceae bacterium]
MPVAAEFTFLDGFWLMLTFFAWVMVIALVIMVLVDNFRREDLSGWAKAGWTLFVIVFPLLGAIVYQIARPRTVSTAPGREATSATQARDDATRITMGLPR